MRPSKAVPTKPRASDPAPDRQRFARSRVSNGKDLLPGIDGRSLVARRYRDIASAVLLDQQNGQPISEARLQLIRRFAACACLAEQMEARLANGETIDISEHSQLCSSLFRLAQRIGLGRTPKNITPTLEEYLEAKRNADIEDDAEVAE
jgi:hypothetical protein